jgi:hypothetical protein
MQDLRLPRKGPTAEAIVRFGDSVIRIPAAAKPRNLNELMLYFPDRVLPEDLEAL